MTGGSPLESRLRGGGRARVLHDQGMKADHDAVALIIAHQAKLAIRIGFSNAHDLQGQV